VPDAWSLGRALAIIALVLGIVVAECGLRSIPDQRQAVAVDPPRVAAPVVSAIRKTPGRGISDRRRASIVAGVVLGRAEDVPPADIERFRRSGLLHLLAASGQNVALLIGICVGGAVLLGGTRVHGMAGAAAAIPAYAMIVGGGPSIVRASIMGELAIAAWLAGRLRDGWHAVFTSAAIIVWVWPGAHRTLGFQLSYACVVGLMTVSPRLATRITERGCPQALAVALSATLTCSIATAPILLLATGQSPFFGIVANLIAIPLASALLVIGLIGCLVGAAVPGLVAVVLAPAQAIGAALLTTAEVGAALPVATTTSWWLGVLVPVGGMGVVLARSRVTRQLAAVIIVGGCVGVGGQVAAEHMHSLPPPAPGVVRVAALDIGQGDASLVESDGAAIVIDVGPPDGHVVDRLHKLSVHRLDGVLLTHDSLDHRGGVTEVVRELHPKWIARPARAAGSWAWVGRLGPPVIQVCDGARITVGQAQLDIRNPPCTGTIPTFTSDPHNDAAVVTVITVGSVRMVVPADAEAPVLNRLDLRHVNVLRVSHHGSDDPDLPELLRRIRPDVAAISVGEGNSYGHPRQTTLDALARAGVPVWRTDRDGTIVFETDGATLWRR
jgi:competence protein ComEC